LSTDLIPLSGYITTSYSPRQNTNRIGVSVCRVSYPRPLL
jgi:hypothetical protein